MKRFLHSASALLLVALLVMTMIPAVFAGGTVTFTDAKTITFGPGSGYTGTDLFDGFKNVMPGDKLSDTITIKNDCDEFDYINVYLRAVAHDENGNPLTYDEVFENTDRNDQAGVEGVRDETVATMADFLSKLTMRVYTGETLLATYTPDQAGALASNVALGSIAPDATLQLRVELDVPIDLGNEYANRVGEVDWTFVVEGIDAGKLTVHKVWDDSNYSKRPESITVNLLKDGQQHEQAVLNEENQWTHTWDRLSSRAQWSVEEVVPTGYEVSYSTEDTTTVITNHRDAPRPIIPIVPGKPEEKPEPETLTVVKVWDDENNKAGKRADSVSVTLYDAGHAVDKVVLSSDNNWTYTWDQLDADGDWYVLETGIPSGYAPVYHDDGTVVTITNVASLPETGQLSWPIPVLGSLGILLVLFGVILMLKKRRSENA